MNRLQFLWDYYKWPVIVCLCSVIVLATFAHMLWEGQKPCRLRACLPLDKALSGDLAAQLKDSGRLVFDTANLKEDENGNTDPADGIEGYYAADLSGTEFADRYNQTEEGEAPPSMPSLFPTRSISATARHFLAPL